MVDDAITLHTLLTIALLKLHPRKLNVFYIQVIKFYAHNYFFTIVTRRKSQTTNRGASNYLSDLFYSSIYMYS